MRPFHWFIGASAVAFGLAIIIVTVYDCWAILTGRETLSEHLRELLTYNLLVAVTVASFLGHVFGFAEGLLIGHLFK